MLAVTSVAPVIDDLADQMGVRRLVPSHRALISPHLIYLPNSLSSLDERTLSLILVIIQIVSMAYHGRRAWNVLDVLLLVRLDIQMAGVGVLRVNVLPVLYRVVWGNVPLLGVE